MKQPRSVLTHDLPICPYCNEIFSDTDFYCEEEKWILECIRCDRQFVYEKVKRPDLFITSKY